MSVSKAQIEHAERANAESLRLRVRKALRNATGQASERQASPLRSLMALLPIAALGGWAASQTLGQYEREPDTWGAQKIYHQQAAASLAGEFRGTLAGFLYARSFEYLHGGVEMRGVMAGDLAQGVASNSEGTVGVIPDAAHDHRGIWGDIERDTSPYMRFHRDRDRTQLLPLFRIMTWADPHFIEGYDLGWFLVFSCASDHNTERAMAFLDEGVQNNPASFLLHLDYGTFQLEKKRDVLRAQQHFLLAARAVDVMDEARFKSMDDQEREEAQRAWEYLVISYRRTRDRTAEMDWAQRGLRRFPESVTCRRSLRVAVFPFEPGKSAQTTRRPRAAAAKISSRKQR